MLISSPKTGIVSNEFCERFSYYGMRAVLTLYLLNVLKFSNDTSTIFFNGFTVLCYLTPLLGSILADGYIGKFRCCLTFPWNYWWMLMEWEDRFFQTMKAEISFIPQKGPSSSCPSCIRLAKSCWPLPPPKALIRASTLGWTSLGWPSSALAPAASSPAFAHLVAISSSRTRRRVSQPALSWEGGRDLCSQLPVISIFFSAFYFSINAGSMISTFITPMFRGNIWSVALLGSMSIANASSATPCLGQDSCYPMAFGIPALLMVFATREFTQTESHNPIKWQLSVVFMAGSFWYKKPPPKENIFGEVYRVSKAMLMALSFFFEFQLISLQKAAVNRWQSQISDAHGHWLDYFFDSHFCAQDQKCRELQKLKKDPRACHKVRDNGRSFKKISAISARFRCRHQIPAPPDGHVLAGAYVLGTLRPAGQPLAHPGGWWHLAFSIMALYCIKKNLKNH
jgi:hypothetical protein